MSTGRNTLLPTQSGVHRIEVPRSSDISSLHREYATATPDYGAGWVFPKIETESTERETLPVRGQR